MGDVIRLRVTWSVPRCGHAQDVPSFLLACERSVSAPFTAPFTVNKDVRKTLEFVMTKLKFYLN